MKRNINKYILFVFIIPFAAGSSLREVSKARCIINYNELRVTKNLGETWSTNDPCIKMMCDLDEDGRPIEKSIHEVCPICEEDFELMEELGTCCGKCIQRKCKYENKIYPIGSTWRSDDNCTILQCEEHNNTPLISAYQKSCPKFPEHCPKYAIYEEDCCLYCKKQIREIKKSIVEDNIFNENYYKNHPCNRECQVEAEPKVCHYEFEIEWYETLSKACFDCPHNRTDCFRPHCIFADGIRRSITVVNRMMPGPSIEVCINDTIVVDVKNSMLGESTTIHWHGLHQKSNPYMDGVPHISQCPILPHGTFRYVFKAENIGTHFWHSHVGMQRGDGTFGPLIVRQPKALDPHGKLYDFDEHIITLQDWAHVTGASMFASHHHSVGDNKPPNILVNGKGRYFPALSKEDSIISQINNNETEGETIKSTKEPQLKAVKVYNGDDKEIYETLTTTEITISNNSIENRNPEDDFMLFQSNPGRNMKLHEVILQPLVKREKRSILTSESETPLETFTVVEGFSYRFRLINAEYLNCPMAVSIDNHTLIAINSDGYDFKAVEVKSIVSYAGERFDFIVVANQPVGNYWIRFKGLMDCDERFTKAFQVAILKYEGAEESDPKGEEPSYDHTPDGIQLNPLNKGSGENNSLTLAEIDCLDEHTDDDWILHKEPDYKFYVYYDFYPKDNPHFHKKDLYGFGNVSNPTKNNLFTPQLNHISLKMPSLTLMPDRNKLNDSMFCNETTFSEKGIDCRQEFCECYHVLQVTLNATVEIILVDEGIAYDANHPFHLHGYGFKVVGLERVGKNVTIEQIKEMDRQGLLKRKTSKAICKDTVTVPDGGYTIIRFQANNPGYWLFHCHIEFHAEIGMALILKIGDHNQMTPVPNNFPSCFDYIPKVNEIDGSIIEDEQNKSIALKQIHLSLTNSIVIILALVISSHSIIF
ncbi:uncharacterized protein LOC129614808 [Condylostylus longicornis]|uniref:uncharacterized protein LOC129614808 n=1 Tax=Condylostylus longicornis TaxID=2530218 RepID=UPI00244DFB43|nr:uncharacterized protein LOC129614808 [Condylostylus longicornis]